MDETTRLLMLELAAPTKRLVELTPRFPRQRDRLALGKIVARLTAFRERLERS